MKRNYYYLSVGDWRSLADMLLAVFDPRLIFVWILALSGAWIWGIRPAGVTSDRWIWAITWLALFNIAAYWLLIPYRTQQRFMLQAIGLLTVPLARLFDRGRWLRLLATALLLVHVFTAQSWPAGPADRDPPWDLSPRVVNMVPSLLLVRWNYPGALVTFMLLGIAALGLAWLWTRPGLKSGFRALAASVLFALLAIPIFNSDNSDPREAFFPEFRDYYRGWIQLDSRVGPRGARVAYAGTNLPYYLLGTHLRNEVRYININAHPGWLLHDYHRDARRQGLPTWPNPWPGWGSAPA